MEFVGFNDIVLKHWQHTGFYKNAAQDLTARLKSVR
jgi:hypothetical protein